MRHPSITLVLILAFAGSVVGQTFGETVAKVRQIKMLASTREDVKKILREYDVTDDDGHYQVFSKDDLTIGIFYSSGACASEPDEENATEDWNVKEWTVTRIEVEPAEPIALRNTGLNLATFKKEPRYPDNADSLVFHDKIAGTAAKTTEDGLEELIFFPPKANRSMLCRTSTAAKGFYTRRGWFSLARPYDYTEIGCSLPASVNSVTLSAVEIDSSDNTIISVSTSATDNGNNVLTYHYTVSAGKIIGSGANVQWDLTGVSSGTYIITVGVDDGAGIFGKTDTKTVVVK